MIQIGQLVSDSLLILYVTALKWWLNNILQYGNMLQRNMQYGFDPYCCISSCNAEWLCVASEIATDFLLKAMVAISEYIQPPLGGNIMLSIMLLDVRDGVLFCPTLLTRKLQCYSNEAECMCCVNDVI